MTYDIKKNESHLRYSKTKVFSKVVIYKIEKHELVA